MTTAGNSSDIAAISNAFTAHWRMFGLYPGAELHDEDGVLWYRSTLRQLPYNAVIRTQIAKDSRAPAIVERICRRYREDDCPFMWVVLPTDRPEGYDSLLRQAGLIKAEEPAGMSLDLDRWKPAPGAPAGVIMFADRDPELTDYEQLVRSYWSIPEEARPQLAILNRHWTGERNPGRRLVAYLDGKPVGKLFINLTMLPDVSVYGVNVIEEARNRGIARALMDKAADLARELGATRMVLHSSKMGRPLYERMGFREHCTLQVYATGPVFGTHHH